MTIWLTSDPHLGHKKICDYSGRPFRNSDEMDAEIIRRSNEKVQSSDTLIYLGDFSFHSPQRTVDLFYQINGNKCLVSGNHDGPATDPNHCGPLWTWIKDYHEMQVVCEKTGKKYHLCLFHFPILSFHWIHKGAIHAHGHSHSKRIQSDPGVRRFDVGVDANDYSPVSVQTLIDLSEKTPVKKRESRK